MKSLSLILYFFVFISCCKATGILDLIKWGMDMGAPSFGREAEDTSTEADEENCECESGVNCKCCMKMNFSLIDLGETGCVNIQYASVERSLQFNMTYGENELHTQSVDVDKMEPVCMNLLGDMPVAYICATLSRFEMESNRMKACIHLEPSILGEAQAKFFVGCFGFNNGTKKVSPTGVKKVKAKHQKVLTGNITITTNTESASVEHASVEQTSASQASGSVEQSGSAEVVESAEYQEEEEEEEELVSAQPGFIEQGASLLSSLFYYLSPDSHEDEDDKDMEKNKIVLVSSTEVTGKYEEVGASELPPIQSSEFSGSSDSTAPSASGASFIDADEDTADEETDEEDEVTGPGGERSGPGEASAKAGKTM